MERGGGDRVITFKTGDSTAHLYADGMADGKENCRKGDEKLTHK